MLSSVFHVLRSKVCELCELPNIYVLTEFNDRRGILPVPLGLNNLGSKEKAKGTNLYEIISLKSLACPKLNTDNFLND